MKEMWNRFLGWEDTLEAEMATYPTVLAWESPSTEEPGGIQSMGSQRVRHDLVTEGQQNTEKSQQNKGVQCNWMQ